MSDATMATILWNQLTRDTKMACGLRSGVYDSNSVTLQYGGRAKRYIRVTLNALDYYDIKTFRVTRDYDMVELDEATNVPVENLNETVYRFCHSGK